MSLVEILLFAQLEIVLFSNTYLEKKIIIGRSFQATINLLFFPLIKKFQVQTLFVIIRKHISYE